MAELLRAALAERFREGEPGACAALIRDGALAELACVGLADPARRLACGPDVNFRLASVSKQFTAMALLILRERGLLGLDETVEEVLPGRPAFGRGVTLRMLARHLSGLPDYEELMPEGRTEQVVDAEIPALVAAKPEGYFAPGSAYRYSNTGYALLALAVEARSGRRFSRFVKDEIFLPLGMADSGYVEREGGEPVARRAYGFARDGDGSFRPADQSPTSAVLGDGGVYTSILDYAKWDEALYGEVLVPRAAMEECFRPGRLADGSPVAYGFGWRLAELDGRLLATHNGETTGFNAAVRRLPSARSTLVVLANRSGDVAHRVADELAPRLLPR